MDRRMYRGNMGNYGRGSRNISPYRQGDQSCNDIAGEYGPEYDYRRDDGYFDDKDCDKRRDRFPIGMAYVPWQKFGNLYENEFAALDHGTLFKDLDYDFLGRSCK